MRLDLFLVENGFVETRSRAKQIIEEGGVRISEKVITKPSFNVKDGDSVDVVDVLKYVSRAGLKLEAAIDEFGVDVNGKICLDVGSSTGGFTDCLLKKGASTVVAVDVGKAQLHESLRTDPRVVLFEETDIREFKTDKKFDIVTVDVSFISLKYILKPIFGFLKDNGDCIALVKPQFEVGRGKTKRGIVKEKRLIESVLSDIKVFALECGFVIEGLMQSPITGKDGNREFLMYLKHG
ncbi:23S rRNA (cytidine-2'-O)-methyltransferase TlyA [Hippea maritima]|uniref:Hemolysin A n=1 Tax=Hippea maritima (strain ATCC 700847 / DSM 10411 / MH2) TaxID=760142 RepID=F2LY81_HIPMA|nr:TlyA family RNA methyltransferase [Hippea maritima]AEA34404.1 hemolysin A [Hippea maritima DSM 10411]